MRLFVYPPVAVSVTTPPVGFLLDGVATTVSQDTVTPANSTPLPVIQLDSNGNPASPLTDAELRASAVLVFPDVDMGAGNTGATTQRVVISDDQAPVAVSGPLTDVELRASDVPVSAASLPLPTGAATETTLSSIDTKLPVALGQQSEATSLSVTLSTENETVLYTILTEIGEINADTPPLVGGRVPVDGSGVTQPISAASLPLPAGAATSANQTTANTSLSTIATNTTISKGAGAVDANTTRVTVSNDGPLMTSIGGVADSAVTNPSSSGSIVALLKGLLSVGTSTFDSTSTQTVSASVVTISPPTGAKLMIIQNSLEASSPVRFTGNSGTPNATTGYYLGIGQSTSTLPAGIVKLARTDAGGDGNVSIAWFV